MFQWRITTSRNRRFRQGPAMQVNILKLVKLPPAKLEIVHIVMVDPKKGPSNALTIQLLKTPGQENKEQNKPEKPKDTKDPKLPGGRNLTMENFDQTWIRENRCAKPLSKSSLTCNKTNA